MSQKSRHRNTVIQAVEIGGKIKVRILKKTHDFLIEDILGFQKI